MKTLKSFVRQSPNHCQKRKGKPHPRLDSWGSLARGGYIGVRGRTYNRGRHEDQKENERPPGHHIRDRTHEGQPNGVTGLGQGGHTGRALVRDAELTGDDIEDWLRVIQVRDRKGRGLDFLQWKISPPIFPILILFFGGAESVPHKSKENIHPKRKARRIFRVVATSPRHPVEDFHSFC